MSGERREESGERGSPFDDRSWRERRHAKKLRKAELRLADAEHNWHKWGFANTPSEDDRAERHIEKLRQKVEALRG